MLYRRPDFSSELWAHVNLSKVLFVMEYDADVLHSVDVGLQLVTVDKPVRTSKLSSPPAGDPLEPHVSRA